MAPSTEPGGSSTISRDGKSFFDVLPRELRDRIYGYTFDHDSMDDYYKYNFKAPLPHLRLVSRQFVHEYDEQTPCDATLFVTGRNVRHGCPWEGPTKQRAPRHASRCTSAEMVLHVGETDGYSEDVNDEQYRVRLSLLCRCHQVHNIMACLDLLQEAKIQLNLNFVQSFDLVYEYMCYWLDEFRYDHGDANGQYTRSKNITVELRQLDLSYPNLPIYLTSDIQDLDILKESATLAIFYDTSCYPERKTVFDAEIERRGAVEAAVLAAWKNQYGCTLSKSAKKAVGIEEDVSDNGSDDSSDYAPYYAPSGDLGSSLEHGESAVQAT